MPQNLSKVDPSFLLCLCKLRDLKIVPHVKRDDVFPLVVGVMPVEVPVGGVGAAYCELAQFQLQRLELETTNET